jgi:hypothetical protein
VFENGFLTVTTRFKDKMTKNKKIRNQIAGLVLTTIFLGGTAYTAQTEAKENEENRIEKSFTIDYKIVDRVEVLEKFLEKYKSPLIAEAKTFVETADEKGLDYRLLPAISCMESGCGKVLIPGTYNAWGWGIYGNNVIGFASWAEGIEKVGEGISKNYAQRGLDTPEKMAPVYTPPNSINWRNGVRSFMSQMDEIALQM